MKRIFILMIILVALTACNGTLTNPTATDNPQVNLPNPASVFCTKNGNKLEIRTATDGSQNGICIFPDGSTCDEWAFFRGECGLVTPQSPTPVIEVEATTITNGGGSGGYMPPGTSEVITDWRGVIKSTETGAEFDDYFELQNNGQIIFFGIDSLEPAIKSQIETLRDSGKIVHLYGTLFSNVSDYNGSQVQVERIEVEE